jgi:two-component system NtrC family sensor kinase
MKKYILLLIMILSIFPAFSQRTRILDDLKQKLAKSKEDNAKIQLYADICEIYGFLNEDSCLYYATRGLELSQKINDSEGHTRMLYSFGTYYLNTGNLPEALKYFIQGQQIAAKNNDKTGIARGLFGFGLLYKSIDPATAIRDMLKARDMNKSEVNGQKQFNDRIDINLGICYMDLNRLDSAFIYLNGLYQRTSPDDFHYSPALLFFGSLQSKMGHTNEAIKLLKRSLTVTQKDNDHYTAADSYYYLAESYNNLYIPDSAIYFAQMAFNEAKQVDRKNQMLQSANLLARLYEPVNLAESYRYLKIARDINDEVYGLKKTQSMQKLVLEEQQQQLKIEQEQIEYKNRLRFYLFISGFVILLVIAFILYRNNLQKKKVNAKLEAAFNNLKSTQSQLIQSEKMASLGELTAGIAHEIQNPLNFVNNFSEVSNELIDEMNLELDKGDIDEAKAIASDIKQNLEKITHHGKRADAIVKGMLQHSRSSSGTKEQTDINALADEYLRLAYHGLRAKDKSFNASMKTDFDENIGNINIVPQDIGRVILNLITNAFYAVNEKKRNGPLTPEGGIENPQNKYEPTVTVSTKLIIPPSGGMKGAVISVRDNGSGIPQKVLDKIFQPFFTTKPTGEGTGLGLSMSYDIVKAHGGELKVVTKEGEGSEFIIQIPVV